MRDAGDSAYSGTMVVCANTEGDFAFDRPPSNRLDLRHSVALDPTDRSFRKQTTVTAPVRSTHGPHDREIRAVAVAQDGRHIVIQERRAGGPWKDRPGQNTSDMEAIILALMARRP